MGAQRSNSRTQFVVVEFGTTTKAGKHLDVEAMYLIDITIRAVLPFMERISRYHCGCTRPAVLNLKVGTHDLFLRPQ